VAIDGCRGKARFGYSQVRGDRHHPAANTLAIAEALTFHQGIGDANKEARLRFLRDRWANRLLASSDRVRLHTSLKPQFSCAIATVQVDGIDSKALDTWLRKEHKILVTTIKHDEFGGLRITPSVYTTLEEIDRFCEAMEFAIKNGLPAEPAES
jgi:selenocysteine lyase/cysteine desulfurase